MNFEIIFTDEFAREVKRLAKKYRSMGADLARFQEELLENPMLGTNIAPNLYKCRMAIASKGKGKSGGARIITYVLIHREQVFLIAIYDKSDTESLSNEAIISRVKAAGLPLTDDASDEK